MERPRRPILSQDFYATSVTVKVQPTPLATTFQQSQTQTLYDAFIISVPKARANPIVLGGPNVDAVKSNGLEIVPGVPVMLSIENTRQLYEVQSPLVDGACVLPEAIPFVVWDVSTVYLVAVAPTAVGVIFFKAMFL
jgi:hypothetical protein